MRPSHEFALRALGVIPPHPEQRQPQAPAETPRDAQGRFITPPGLSLRGGDTPPPPAPRTPDTIMQDHNRLLAALLGPVDLGG